ncbi:C-reactive protein-like [Gastrophryne carolinensis]
MTGKSFFFPLASALSHVTLFPDQNKTLDQFSACARYRPELTQNFGIFSMATHEKDKVFEIFHSSPNKISVAINNHKQSINALPSPSGEYHACVTWKSATGIQQTWINGINYPGQVSAKGTAIAPGNVIFGQYLDIDIGISDPRLALGGDMLGFSSSDYVMSPDEIQQDQCGTYQGNIINWHHLNYAMTGGVVVRPSTNECSPTTSSIVPAHHAQDAAPIHSLSAEQRRH